MRDSDRSQPILSADDFLLRPWAVEDASWYVESRDEEVFAWTTERRDLTVEETEEGIRRANSGSDAVCCAIADRRSGQLLGNIALAFREDNRKSAEIMYWLAPWARGRGIATKAVMMLCTWAFDALELERVTLQTHAGNVRSQLVAQRAGFQRLEDQDGSGSAADHLWFVRMSDRGMAP